MTKAKLISEYENLKQEYQTLKQKNNTLQTDAMQKDLLIAQLQKMLFGSKSERFKKEEVSDIQMSLFEKIQAEELAKQLAEKENQKTNGEASKKQIITYERNAPKKKLRPTKRIPLPENLPRVKVIIEPEGKTEDMVKIGEEVTEILDIIPPVFRVIQVVRPKYTLPKQENKNEEEIKKPILIAPIPLRVIDKGIPSVRLLVYILINKFMDHLPYYRQIKIFQRIGVEIKSNTINGWISKTCVLLKPLYDAFCKHQFSKKYLQADETTIKVLRVKKNKKSKAHTGYYWVYFDPVDKHVVFIFNKGRGRKYPAEHLEGFSGNLQTDGLSIYDDFDKKEGTTLHACMAHIRRKFVDALANDKNRAQEILIIIQQLYAIERTAREHNYTAQERLTLRQEKAVPLMDNLKTYLDQYYESKEVLPQSAIGQAVRYALGRWKYMKRYLADGVVEIDNNWVENAIRPIALGRKNYLFAGSEKGAEWGAMIYTLLGSAMRHGHDPMAYLSDVLRRLPDTKLSNLHLFFPSEWTPNPENSLDLL